MQECLDARGGEGSALTSAAALGTSYAQLSGRGRRSFLVLVATEFDVDHDAVARAAETMLGADEDERRRAEEALRVALEAPWLRLLRQFNGLPEGTRFLVDLRADLARFAKYEPTLVPLERDLKLLLKSWFDVGFLDLRRITWDSPASLLERLARSEAVHAVNGWADLKNRLDADRRFFAFFHPRMPDDPLIFVEVALSRGIAQEIGPLLDQGAPSVDASRADTAVFYSISNAQKGLGGIPFGGFLIKRVVDELSAELPQLRTFATLSPIPRFRAWLEGQPQDTLLLAEERRELEAALGTVGSGVLLDVLRSAWTEDEAVAAALKQPLMRLCARYLLRPKRSDETPVDPVANFHLTNGARVEQISWLADRSPKAVAESAGLMVNYLYVLDEIESNREVFTDGRGVAASDAITGLARERGANRRRRLAADATSD
jgi:malonyl-CoA decarboxylase